MRVRRSAYVTLPATAARVARILFISCVLLAANVLLLGDAASAVEVFMPRYPAISPDGSVVVFGFQGDLWRVPAAGGQATRLTAHEAYDTQPLFSPDGKTIAFGSNRYGEFDIYTMPADGGPPGRITHASRRNLPGAFGPDGETLYFASARLFDYPVSPQIQFVPATGGTPRRLADFFGDEVATADGKTFVIAAGRVKPARVRYRGSYQREIYSYTVGRDPVRLTDNRGYDTNPMVAPDGRIYWIGDQDEHKTANIWTMNADGSDKRALTRFRGDGVRSAKLSADGRYIVLEQGTAIHLLATAQGDPRQMTIQVAADMIENPIVIENKTGDADEIAVATGGDEIALAIEGEIVLINNDLGGRARLVVPGPYLEQHISFRPGSADTLLFVTDRQGEQTVCLLVSDDPEETILRLARRHRIIALTDGKQPAYEPRWSPDGRRILYTRGYSDLHVMDADGGGDKTLFEHWGAIGYSWSPDGEWVACSRLDGNFNRDIWILPGDGGEAVNITRHPDYDRGPVWSADGRMLAWSTNRHDNSPDSRHDDVYFVYLTREDDERTEEEWKIWEKTRDKKETGKKGKGKKGGGKPDDPAAAIDDPTAGGIDDDEPDADEQDDEAEGDDEEEPVEVVIDFEDIHLRSRRLTKLPGTERARGIDPRGDRIYFTATIDGNTDLMSVDRFGEEREAVTENDTDPRRIALDPEGKTFYFLQDGKPARVPAAGGKVEKTDFRARLTIDRPALRRQVLDEAWRIMRDRFYDEDMHGVDWPALRRKYGEWVQQVGHDMDFAAVFNLMLGELNSSHMGYYARWDTPGDYGDDGYLGLELVPRYEGQGLKIAGVLPYGPCDKVKSRLLPGDILLTVDGMPVSAEQNLFRALENRADLPTWLTVERDGEELEFEVVPVVDRLIFQLKYRQMEKQNQQYTAQQSDDRIGYVHIRGMGMTEVERFEQNLFAAANGKEALIIDVRNNGGGWTTDLLLTILTQPVHAYTILRNGEIGYPQSERQTFYRWEKPIAVLCNEGSYSNAEIFSHAIKTIGRGPVIGAETGGNVISTGGFSNRYRGRVRLPFRGWYVWGDAQHPERNHKPQEAVHDLSGCIPDYLVDLTPADRLHHRDPQLDKAIELMLEAANAERQKPQRENRPNR